MFKVNFSKYSYYKLIDSDTISPNTNNTPFNVLKNTNVATS